MATVYSYPHLAAVVLRSKIEALAATIGLRRSSRAVRAMRGHATLIQTACTGNTMNGGWAVFVSAPCVRVPIGQFRHFNALSL